MLRNPGDCCLNILLFVVLLAYFINEVRFMQAKQDGTVNEKVLAEAEKRAAAQALAKTQDEIRKRRKALGDTPNAGVAQALRINAAMEYNASSYLGSFFYKLDQYQASVTGLAVTDNTQKTLDADVLSTPKL